MLHEVLLALSGIPSPIWDKIDSQDGSSEASLTLDHTTPAEKVMLRNLKDLSELHIKVKTGANECSRSHPSAPCRAVSARIRSRHLAAFTNKIVAVESAILHNDSRFVSAYKAVPLSALVTEFEPWRRSLNWMSKIVVTMQQSDCNTSKLIKTLDTESHTGYNDILDLSIDLLKTAQEAWLQTLMPWLLYGQLPHFGKDDFMIVRNETDDEARYAVNAHCIPHFVSKAAATNILAIGEALDQLSIISPGSSTHDSSDLLETILPFSLDAVKTMALPVTSHNLADTVRQINGKISDVALSRLLSIEVINDFLFIARQFVLLQDGEFSATLIREADKAAKTQLLNSASVFNPGAKAGRLDKLMLSDSEIASILDHTWSELLLQASEEKVDNSVRAKATSWLRFQRTSTPLPISNILPVPVCTSIQLPKGVGLNMFVKKADISRYEQINSVLLSIHRAQTQLHKLWQMPLCRRTTVPRQSTRALTGDDGRSQRQETRQKRLRSSWACASQCLFFLSELHNHIHGEILHSSWLQFHTWLQHGAQSRPASAGISRPGTSAGQAAKGQETTASGPRNQDPRSIAQAHRQFLKTLHECLMLQSDAVMSGLRDLLGLIDHFVALFSRLQTTWQAIDIQSSGKYGTAPADLTRDESDILKQLTKTNGSMTELIHELVAAIRDVSHQRDMQDMSTGLSELGAGSTDSTHFVPWKARTLNRLLMKLDSLSGVDCHDHYEDALLELEDS